MENINKGNVIGNQRITMSFRDRKSSLFSKGRELTKGIGFNAAIFSGGKWHNSNEADFEVKQDSEDKVLIELKWWTLPVTQSWSFCLTEQGVKWDIDLQIEKQLIIDKKSVSVFLSENYTHWFSVFKEGRFPNEFRSWEDMFSLWEDQFIFSQDKSTKLIGVKSGENLPSIILDLSSQKEYVPKIQNTHQGLSSRVLKAETQGDAFNLEPGKYCFFSALMRVIEKDSELKSFLNIYPKRLEIDGYTRDTEPIILEKGYVDPDAVYIFGDFPELHNKISLVAVADNFEQALAKVKIGKNIKIGISRYNFFRLNKIIEFCSSASGSSLDTRAISLNLFPVRKLYDNFIEYLRELRTIVHSTNIQLVFKDEELLEILQNVSLQATQDNQKDILRLLGVISEHVFIGPQTAVIDSYHRCNTNCLHCWVHSPGKNPSKEFLDAKLDIELYKHIVDDLSSLLVDEIIFAGDGEPLLDQRFPEMLEYAWNKALKVLFFTNGILLNKEIAANIVNLGVSQIFCSLPAGTPKTYRLINPSQSEETFGNVVENLKRLIFLRNQAGKKRPLLLMTHVIHKFNYKELMDMSVMDVAIGADIVRFYLIRLDKDIDNLRLNSNEYAYLKDSLSAVKSYLDGKKVELQNNIDFQLENYNEADGAWSKDVFLKVGCPVGWFFCLIPAKADMSFCCHLKTTGFLNESSFRQIWESNAYRQYRIQAKYLSDNKDALFLNGAKLYDEHCGHCDTHQVIFRINEMLAQYGLKKYL